MALAFVTKLSDKHKSAFAWYNPSEKLAKDSQ
jgi:hypothetical protein